jgi:hypothetical protein
VLNPTLRARIPAPVQATIDSVQRRLFDGSLRVVDSTGAVTSP